MKKLAIIGASYLQEPLIQKAKQMGIETHVFAWAANDVGEKSADFFYPISITEKDAILKTCIAAGIDGICSIASDLAAITVNYVAYKMGLICNSPECVLHSTNKHEMRKCYEQNRDPSPKSIYVTSADDLKDAPIRYPVIVKPVDRSGSRGITKVTSPEGLSAAIELAKEQGFDKHALIEEFISGQEYSVECISWQGEHHFLALTQKYTTGAPHYIETAHLEPAPVSAELLNQIKDVVYHSLNSLNITNGASHTEIKITPDKKIFLIETGGRMGGDCIGSHLVELSTGFDFVRAVIQIALGETPDLNIPHSSKEAAVRFIISDEDFEYLDKLKREHPELLLQEEVRKINRDLQVTDSSTRYGYYIMHAALPGTLSRHLPNQTEDTL